jgi:hypothetical protein
MDNEIPVEIKTLEHSESIEEIPLKLVLDQSEEIKENIRKVVDQISSVNAIFKQDKKIYFPYPTIEQAIAQNEEAERRINKAVGDLHQVNTELAKQVAERIDIESELKQTKSELFDIRADLSKSQLKEQQFQIQKVANNTDISN